MKKLKKIWQENSILFVLLLILIACLVAISVVVVTYFVGDSSSKYGDRLDKIEEHPFDKEAQDEIIAKMTEDESIEKATIRVSGKIIYVSIDFVSKISLVEAQGKALSSVEYFSDDVLSFYDLQYLIKADDTEETEGFQLMGSHNVNGTGGIVWNNNTQFVDDKEE